MKKIYFLLLAFSFFTTANAQIVNIPDANFKAKLLEANYFNGIAQNLSNQYIKIDANNDGQIQESEALQVKVLDIPSAKIESLMGLEKFTNLQGLNCTNNKLTILDVTNLKNLKELFCSTNQLISINVSGLINMQNLDCDSNQLTSINILGLKNLINLNCGFNKLSSINVTESISLKTLSFSGNHLSTIDLTSLVGLEELNCEYNQLSALDVTNLKNLKRLICGSNLFTNLNLNALINLTVLNYDFKRVISVSANYLSNLPVTFNKLKSLDVSKLITLTSLSCSGNEIVNLDISKNVNLTALYCQNNLLTTLNIAELKKLVELYCGFNLFKTIDATNSRALCLLHCQNNANLESIFVKGINFCVGESNFNNNPKLGYVCGNETDVPRFVEFFSRNLITGVNVNSYCSFNPGGTFYTIQGNQKLDSNKNGCDVNDIIMPNLKYNITNGSITGSIISDIFGNYSIPVSAGTHTITPKLENPTYFTVSPTTVNVTFPTQTSPVTQNFCITPNGVRPDLEVTLLPLQPARPGFDAKYKLVYKNKGNTIQSGSVKLTFNDAVLDFVIANPLTSTPSTNTLSWNFTNLQPFETREITFTMNVNSPMEIPAVNNGDILNFTTTITSLATDETPADNAFTFNQTVVGSYDPNDKTCLEGTTISPALIGQYVHYMIRFENTGTFAAENVVIKDMIDLTKFDISTLIPTSASHSFVTKISDGNKVEFIFEKINLPFDNANNDGYIAFKIKTKPTLVVNDSFTNEANIYFDYNFPILTNKATSTFKTLGTQDFDFGKYFTLYPNPAKADLNITAKETINVNSISVYNTLGQLVLVATNAYKVSKIDVSSLTSGNYFLQIKTDKGSSNARFVKE